MLRFSQPPVHEVSHPGFSDIEFDAGTGNEPEEEEEEEPPFAADGNFSEGHDHTHQAGAHNAIEFEAGDSKICLCRRYMWYLQRYLAAFCLPRWLPRRERTYMFVGYSLHVFTDFQGRGVQRIYRQDFWNVA